MLQPLVVVGSGLPRVQGAYGVPLRGGCKAGEVAGCATKMRVFKRCIGDFEENSTSLEGRLDSSKSPRSNPPLLEGPLEISNFLRSMGGGSMY